MSNGMLMRIQIEDRIWINWENSECMSWEDLKKRIEKAKSEWDEEYIIVEGFCLLSNEEIW
jgi:hypothetical protein